MPADATIGIADAHLQSDLAWNAGVRWQRILFYWDAIQPDWNGQMEPNRFVDEAMIDRELRRGYQLVGVIGNPPRWATGEGSVPIGLNLPLDDPANSWARFTRQLATKYAGRIDTWIIWNEPDIHPSQYGSTWNGSEAEYWQLLKTASKAIRQGNPKATVGFAGTTYWADARAAQPIFLRRVLDVAAKDPEAAPNGFFFDFVPLHVYSSPYKIYEIAQTYRDALSAHGLAKPFWLTETNVVPHDDPHSSVGREASRGTLQEQASFVIQATAMALAAGIERIQFYKMMDGPIENGEPFGLVTNDGTVRPAYVSLQTAARHLLGGKRVSYQLFDGVARVTIESGSRWTTVIWATQPRAITVQMAPLSMSARVIDKFGAERPLGRSATGAYELSLAPATANTAQDPSEFIIGGDPLIVIEEGVPDVIELSPSATYFALTGFNVGGARLEYFKRRGGLETFGYPISRPFRFLGRQVQMFQRQVMEERPDGSIGTVNVLDEGLLPFTRFNGAVIPGIDREFTATAPTPGSRDYGAAIVRWVQTNAPDVWETMPVNFRRTFERTVSFETAFPEGRGNRAVLPGLNLELWGVPTSRPARDPANHNFVYQRFQRGVMHYDHATGTTQGMLLAAYLKAILTGQELPEDLEKDSRDSRLYRQYDRTKPHGIARPDALPDSDLTNAFERELPAR